MAQFIQGSGHRKNLSEPIAGGPARIEILEARQLLSASAFHDTVIHAAMRSAPAALMQAKAPSTTPTERLAQQAAAKQAKEAAAAARRQQAIQKSITAFVAQITKTVRHYKLPDSQAFQAKIDKQQTVFATKITREGGSFTPIPFETLLVGSAPTPPAAPTLTATAASSSEIDLTWTAVTAAVSYKVEGSTDGGTTWTTLTSTATTSYSAFGLTADTSYKYRVTAFTPTVATAASNTATITTLLTAPTNFAAAATSPTSVTLTWTAVADATGYKIERSLNGGSWSAFSPSSPLTGSSATTTDATVAAGTTYYYRISSLVGTASSSPAGAVVASTYAIAPTVTATTISASEIDLSWTTVQSAFSYKLETSVDGGTTWTVLATQPANTFANTGLAADTSHKYRVSAINAAGASAVSATVTNSTLLNAPTGFTEIVAATNEIDLSWIAVADTTTYKLERSTDNVAWTTIVPGTPLVGSSTSYHDTTLNAGTMYYYRISAIDAAGTSVTATTASAFTLPVAPTATATPASTTEIDLSWAAITSASSYRVERSTDGGASWTTLANPTTLTYANTGLTADTSYKYRVSALNNSGFSAPSAVVTATTPLVAPAGFTLTVASATEIDLSWTTIADATSYKIERSINGTAWTTLVAAQAGASDNYADTTATAGAIFYYRISAANAQGTSAPTAAVSALTVPAQPIVTATLATPTSVNLSWGALTGAATYKLESSANGGATWSTLVAASTATTYANTGLSADSTYKYRVTAVNATGTSVPSAVASASTPLVAPSGFAGTVVSPTEIDLTWTPEFDATTYKIERSTDNTTWTAIVPVTAFTAASTSYADTGLSSGSGYYYRLSSSNGAGFSATAPIAILTTLPAAPVVTATVKSATEIDLAWPASHGATAYKIERSTDGGVSWATLVATQAGATYANTGLTADTSYSYRVTALNGSDASLVSAAATGITLLPAPTGLTLSVPSSVEIDLAWNAVPDAVTYKVEKSVNGSTWTTLAASQSGVTYSDATLSPGLPYYYRVSAINANGTSAPAVSASTLTLSAAPTLSATVFSSSQVNLSWTASVGAANYKLDSSSDGGNTWTQLVLQAGQTYSNTGLAPNLVYKYRVSAINASGASAASAVQSVNTSIPSPTNLAAKAASATEIDLTWTAVANATTYKVERSLGGTSWTTLIPSPALTGANVTFADSGVTPGATYSYRISAVVGAGTSAPSATVTGLSFPIASVLTATPTSTTQINLSWTASATATSYKLERSADNGVTWTTAVTQAGTTYSNTGLTAATPYKYRVSAINASGATVSAVVATSTVLLDPTNLAATPASATQVNLAWSPVTNAVAYKIEQSPDGNTWTTLMPMSPLTSGSVSYSVTGLAAGTTYYFRLTATNSAGTMIPAGVVQTLTVPAGPTVSAVTVSPTEVDLSWPPTASATSYIVETSIDSGATWTPLATQANTTYANTGLAADTLYKYRVSAVNASGTSATGTLATITTLLAPPTGFTTSVASGTQINLAWTTVNDASTYKIERSVDNIAWTTLAPSPALNSTSTSYHDTTVSPGMTYYYRISATNSAGTSTPTVSSATLTLPAAPTLTVASSTPTSISLSWTPSVSATSYLLERSANAGVTWTSAVTQSTTTYANTGLTPNTAYQFRVTAINGTGSSTVSSTASATTPLATPTGFGLTVASATEIDLAWNAVASATNYKIERSPNGTTWTTLTTMGLTGASDTYADTTVAAGTTYYYRISATSGSGVSVATAASSALTLSAAPVLTATVVSAAAVNLAWNATTGAATYKIESSTNGGTTWGTLAAANAGITYAVTGLAPDTVYTFRVSATNATGASAPSATVTVTTPLSAPSSFTATVASATEIDLAWAPVVNATSYIISRSLNNTVWTTLSTPGVNGISTTFADTTVAAGTTYYYHIAAHNAAGSSATASIGATLTLPAAPVLTATTASSTSINLAWPAVLSATAYKIERSTDGGTTWSSIVPTQPGITYVNTGLTADTAYKYRVSSINATGTSAASSAVSATTLLAAPSGFSLTVASATEVDLAWSAVADATGFKIERSLNNTAWTTLVAAGVTGTSMSYANTGLTAGTTYYYRLSAIDAVGVSTAATAAAVLTLPAAPTLTAGVISATQINLSWTASASATSYKLEKSTDNGNTWSTVVTQATLTYSNTGLTADTAYQYRVTAMNATGSSFPSAVVFPTTLLAAPTGFTAVASSATVVNLGWAAIADATSWHVDRSVNNTTWTGIASPAAGATSYSDTTAVAGTTYYYRLSALSPSGISVPTAAITVLTYPAAPVVAANPTSATTIALTWPAILSATTYKVEQSTDGGFAWTTLAAANTTPSYTVTGLTADTSYKFRVSAINTTGTSAASSTATAVTFTLAPTGVTATAALATEIDLAWNAVTDATGYKIEQSSNGTTWTTLSTSSLNSSSVSFAVTGLTAGTMYYFRMSTISASGTSSPTTAVSASTLSPTPTITTSVISSTQINLSWGTSTGATSYKVEVNPAGGGWTTLATPVTTSYFATGLTPDTVYQFRVSAVNASGTSNASAAVTATTYLTSPIGFSDTVISATEVDLSWTAVTDAVTYKVERSLDNIAWSTLTSSDATITYHDSAASAGTLYYYRVSAVDGAGVSAPAPAVNGLTYPAVPVVTGAPISSTSISLSWPAIKSASSYNIQISSDAGMTWSSPGVTQAGTTYIATGLTANTPYQFQVLATNASASSAESAPASVSTLLVPPAGLAATVVSATEVTLAWTAEAGATTYKVERSPNGTNWGIIAAADATNSYDDATLAAGTTYYYRISGSSAAGTSSPATAVTALTLPATPTLSSSAITATSINFSWTASIGATGYTLQSSVDSGMTWQNVVTQAGTTYAATGLTANTPYEFQVEATNASGSSPFTAPVSLSTLLVAPAGLATTVVSASEIDLAWTAESGATTYKVERSPNNSTWSTIAAADASNSFSDTGLAAGTIYYYRISGASAAGTSAPATAVSGLTLPVTPTLSDSAITATTIGFSWTASHGASGYTLQDSTDSGMTWTDVVTQASTTYTATNLTSDTPYEFQIKATNASGSSAYSTALSAATVMPSPINLSATVVSGTEITLMWFSEVGADTYKLERSLNNSTWSTIAAADATNSYDDTGLTPGTTYYYRVSATDANGTSAPGTGVSTVTAPAIPTLSTTSVGATSISFSWTASPTATGYTLQDSSDAGMTWTTAVTQAGVSYSVTGLSADTSYQFKILASNGSGSSLYSAPVTIKTLLASPAGLAPTVVSASEVDLAWTAEAGATTYKVERSLNNSTWSTIAAADATNSYNDTTLNAGTTYYYRISGTNATGTSAPASSVNALTLPATPTLSFSNATASSINFSWTPSASATAYTLQSSVDSGMTWLTVVTQAGNTYVDSTALASNTPYQFQVLATNGSGSSPYSAPVSVSTLLAAPAGLAPTVISAAEIDLAWTSESGAATYKVERSPNGTSWSTIAAADATNSYHDTSLLAGTTYYYRISGTNTAGTSAPAAAVHAITWPATPTLTGIAVSDTQINFSWSPSLSATGYTLQSSADSGMTWTNVVTQAGVTYNVTTGLTADTAYEFQILATNGSGSSPYSSPITVSTLLSSPAGLAPTVISATEVDLAWTSETGAATYKVERSVNNTTWTTIAAADATNSYADTALTAGTTYYYRISATDAAGTSLPAVAVNALTDPAAPTLTTTVISAIQINVSWTTTPSATGYTLTISGDGGMTWSSPGVTQTNTTYSNTGLTAGTLYQYRVTANNASGSSAHSTAVSATTLLAAPTTLTATAASSTSVTLAWSAIAGSTNYKVERSVNNSTWTTVSTPGLTGASTGATDSTVLAGTTYYYRLSAISASGTSLPGAVQTVVTPLAAPVGLAANAVSATQINLTWTKDTAAGLTGFGLYVSSDGVAFTLYETLDATATSAPIAGLTTATLYYYRLVAINAGGNSAPSAIVHATTM
ncbi:MAG TPA: fibronectin type III domain-containing protein [Tepidisphaeraceae bacterium]|jgi:titin|nr:fibronectin type III domain-containing protein [Tepidisphaeraceae bacterium]